MVGLGLAALVPMARVWKWSRQSELRYVPRPGSSAQVHSAGRAPDRVLLIGNGMAVGWGVISHDVGLGGALARALTASTGRAVDIDIIADPDMGVASAIRIIRRAKPQRYDGVVATIGVNAALDLTGRSRWQGDLTQLLSVLAEDLRPGTPFFLVGIQPIRSIPVYDDSFGGLVNVHAVRLNGVSERVCSANPRAHFVPITSPPPSAPPRFRDGSAYQHWAQEIAAIVAPQLDQVQHLVPAEYTTSSRDAVSEFAAADPELRAQFDSIVKQALSTLGGTGAAFAVIEDDGIVFKARAGTVPEHVEFGGSFTASVIAARGALIVSDAATDERFRSNPNVVGDIAIRHFAGFPVESANGERVGVICVFGPRPKPHDSELVEVVLRQLALHIQEVVRPN